MSERRFYAIFGLKGFAEWSTLTSEYFIDYRPQYREINHRKFFAGMAPELKLAYRILDRLEIIAATGLRVGYYSTEGKGRTQQGRWEQQPGYAGGANF